MGLRRGLLFGLLAGSAIAAVLTKTKKAEAPAAADSPEAASQAQPEGGATGLKATIDALKRHAKEAIEAAHEARGEKETELQRQFDEARHKSS